MKQQLYKKLKHNPQIIPLGGPDDLDYAAFLANETTNNPGYFTTVIENADTNNFEEALNANSNVYPMNPAEENQVTVNNIYLNSFGRYYTLDAAQTQALNIIAYSEPASNGNAVYCARVMLGLDIDDPIISGARMVNDDLINAVEENPEYSVFPNPANNSVTVTGVGEFILYDINGSMVKSIKMENFATQIDLNEVQNGVYLYKISNAGEMKAQGKLVIVK